jgi:outer membrane lipoprotein-sorting protein
MADLDSRGRSPVAIGAVALLLVVAAAAGATAIGGDPSGEQLLDDTTDRYHTAETVVGTANVTVTNDTVTRTATVDLAVARPNSSRVSVVTPDTEPRTVGTNGSVAWAHDEASGQLRVVRKNASGEWSVAGVTGTSAIGWNSSAWTATAHNGSHNVSKADLQAAWNRTAWAREPGALVAAIDGNTTAERLGRESISGTDAYHLRVTPTNGTWNATVEVWVGADVPDLLRAQIQRDGWTTTIDYDLTVNASVHESTFQPPTDRAETVVAPQTADSYDAAVEAAGRDLPRLDASGFEFTTATIVERDGVTTVAQTYDNGSAAVVLASADAGPDALPYGAALEDDNATTVDIDGTTATVVERDGRVAVVWTVGDGDDERTLAVVAQLPTDAVVDLAGTVSGVA